MPVYTCSHGNIYGPFSVNPTFTKTFSNLPPHYEIYFTISLYYLWSWDGGEFVTFTFDGTKLLDQATPSGTYTTNCVMGGWTGTTIRKLNYSGAHTSSTAKFDIDVILGSAISDEAFGLSLFSVYVRQCYNGCRSCSGPLAT